MGLRDIKSEIYEIKQVYQERYSLSRNLKDIIPPRKYHDFEFGVVFLILLSVCETRSP